MRELIKDIILNVKMNTGIIADSEILEDVIFDLQEDGLYMSNDEDELIDLINNNEILQLTKVICEDCGKVRYLVESIFDEDGNTIPDELDDLYIQDELIDCIDLEAFDVENLYKIKYDRFEDNIDVKCDKECECCPCCNKESIDEEDEDDCGSIENILFKELLDEISDLDPSDTYTEEVFALVYDKLKEAVECGYDTAVIRMKDMINEM